MNDARALVFTIPGVPVPCARVRVVQGGHAFTPDRTRSYERHVALIAQAAASRAKWSARVGDIYELRIDVHRAARRGDWDNFAKAIADGLTKARVWADDRFVEVARVRLFVAPKNPRVDVEVWVIESRETT